MNCWEQQNGIRKQPLLFFRSLRVLHIRELPGAEGCRIRMLCVGMVAVASHQLFVVLFFKHTKAYYMFIYLVLPTFIFLLEGVGKVE